MFSKIIGTELPGDGTIYVSQFLRFLVPVTRGNSIKLVVRIEKDLGNNHFLLSTNCYSVTGVLLVEGEAEVLVNKGNG